ncbi:MAG: DoxX family protein [Rhizobiales bacterium]|nr:DoxX family protein [Hyphomicrobiales bacterium]
MQMLFIVGRVLFVVIFLFSGAEKLMDVAGTAAVIAPKVTVPEALRGIAAQVESASGMTTPQLLAIISGVVELAGGLLIAFNIGTRAMAFLLVLFSIAATYYFHDFWNMTGAERGANMIHALKNVSLIGALLVLMSLGPWRRAEADTLRDI